jgi:C-terminal processing protease CtpA/Prc
MNNNSKWMHGLHQLNKRASWIIVLAALALIAGACRKKDDVNPSATSTDTETNDWILENMQTYYYWNKRIPAKPDKSLDPKAFFASLLYTYASQRPDGDRFSFIEENAETLKAALSGEEQTTGAEYTLYRESKNSNDLIAQIMYVLPGSPAAKSGLKRGDIIYQVNGQTLTVDNYYSLLFGQSSLQVGLAKWQNNVLVKTTQTLGVTTEVFQENPVLLDSIYTVSSSKVGYLVYNQFIPGPNGSKIDTYDQQVDQVFSAFKLAGVNELILDLRYNSGGYVSSSVNLASLIGKGVDGSKIYYRQEWNEGLTPELKKTYGDDFFVEKFVVKSQNIGNQLSRVFILTTDHTASASELIINGLKPYMNVVTIGTTTAGKNVGSITLTDDSGKVKWGLQPIVFKSFNSLNQSDYTAGFTPSIEVHEPVDLKPLGDVQEAYLSTALSQITGVPNVRRGVIKPSLPIAGSSIERKAGGGNMFDRRVNKLPIQQ